MKMNRSYSGILYKSLCALLLVFPCLQGSSQVWTRYVRTAGHGVSIESIPQIISQSEKTHVYGIEIDNDITGRYESFLDPREKLAAIKAMADSTHLHGNKAFVYVAGLECITANADKTEHTFYKDHPDWVQRNIKGEPAIFGSKDAFWITEGDEDVWISPYAPEWRKIYMERMRQIAATGIDGIYMDIPYWMTHFTNWEDTWASFDQYTVAAFKKETGIDALKQIKIGDWNDPDFIAWVNFRIRSITDFIREVNKNIKSVAPECKLMLEIYPGMGEAVPRVGADNYQLYQVADVIAHEFNPGDDINGDGGNSARSNPLSWMQYMAGMYSFRAMAGEKASWMLSYSWDGEERIAPADAMNNLFVSQVVAGTNPWDAERFVMSGSNDYDRRTHIYQWIAEHQELIYNDRKPMSPIGVYFSPDTRNYFTAEWKRSYFGVLEYLMIHQMEFEIITPDNLVSATSNVVIMPDVKSVSEKEYRELKHWVDDGKALILTGETGAFDENRMPAKDKNRMKQLSQSGKRVFFFEDAPEKGYYDFLGKWYNQTGGRGQKTTYINKDFDRLSDKIGELYRPEITIRNAEGCLGQMAEVDGKKTVFLANYSGLVSKENAIPDPQTSVEVIFHRVSKEADSASFTPFLGKTAVLKGERSGNDLVVRLPSFLNGAVITLD